ncbi:mitochondrial UDP-N-acetylglucosamine--lysosomal-enzyme N-acetylglucosamine phosphotransferase [Andalucia godoyi]|uniref:Mitochondrial UDP-N-acetylglucosamine--lysosomal-enzyme N-acetylglucosamine phosphotransferase n=1 Tax=Andalucia godoyi TaxID=505711 RepID=A0A8K0AJ67_ANDGO|nr:mitochondrial UDP-N-acetylglucosamine--lysosomal-enzyme N-acetylglucosamine phosphotransferase [Andalucia godoyi]|eukprot:ANDGO_03694.mRNA.1 mitochondrial UDP-N-acetylglucosamine--lysosomal-enzyme N-acetylglucosamine phosphotransferase
MFSRLSARFRPPHRTLYASNSMTSYLHNRKGAAAFFLVLLLHLFFACYFLNSGSSQSDLHSQSQSQSAERLALKLDSSTPRNDMDSNGSDEFKEKRPAKKTPKKPVLPVNQRDASSLNPVSHGKKKNADDPVKSNCTTPYVDLYTLDIQRVRERQQHDAPDGQSFQIDAVFTWVDGNDPPLASKRMKYVPASASLSANKSRGSPIARNFDVCEKKRYTNHDEIRFALRSIEKFTPWIRNIYIVTDDQKPAWLNVDHPQIKLKSHTEIWTNASLLPVFNSFAIESQIFNIPDLAEYVFIMNDDMMFGKPQEPLSWVSPTNGPLVFVEERMVNAERYTDPEVPLAPTGPVSEWDSLDYSTALLNARFGKRPRGYVSHMPVVVETSLARECIREFQQQFLQSSGNRFRGLKDIHIKFMFTHFRMERFREELFLEGMTSRVDQNHDGAASLQELVHFGDESVIEPSCRRRFEEEQSRDGSVGGLQFRQVLVHCPQMASYVANKTLEMRGIHAGDPWYVYQYDPSRSKRNLFTAVNFGLKTLTALLDKLWTTIEPDTMCFNDDTTVSLNSRNVDALTRHANAAYDVVTTALSRKLGDSSSYEV